MLDRVLNPATKAPVFGRDDALAAGWAVSTAPVAYPQAVAARELTARLSPLGGWERVYLRCDGSVDTAYAPDGNFADWEEKNFANSFPTPNQ